MTGSKIALAILISCIALSATWSEPGQGAQMTAAEASRIAQQQTGGRVLTVKPAEGGYQVKVLTPDGKVRYVFVPNR